MCDEEQPTSAPPQMPGPALDPPPAPAGTGAQPKTPEPTPDGIGSINNQFPH